MYKDILQQLKFIDDKKSQEHKLNNQELISVARDIPTLIRTNGLYPTLEFLAYKKSPSPFFYSLLVQYLDDKELMSPITTKLAYDYMIKVIEALTLLDKDVKDEEKVKSSQQYEKIKNRHKSLFCSKNYKLKFDKGFCYQTNSNKNAHKITIDLKHVWKDSKEETLEQVAKAIKDKENMIQTYAATYDIEICSQTMTLLTNLIIGLGEPSVRESSMKLDHILGIPFIPASTLKGAFRAYLTHEVEGITLDVINELFGKVEAEGGQQGRLIFWDAYPSLEHNNSLELILDGFTPMSEEEEDVQSKANPIKMISVKKGAKFKVHISIDKSATEKANDLLDNKTVIEHFSQCISDISLGAKKSVGYGVFSMVNTFEQGRD